MRAIAPFFNIWTRVQLRNTQSFRVFCRYNHRMTNNHKLEEQTFPFYQQKRYYPVTIGQVLKNRYRIVTKLGYGTYSAAWLAWDDRYPGLSRHDPSLA